MPSSTAARRSAVVLRNPPTTRLLGPYSGHRRYTRPPTTAMDADGRYSLAALPKTWRFTAALPPDPLFPTPAASHAAPRARLGPRLVRGALFTWVRPEEQERPELLAVSPAALRDLRLRPSEAATDDFRETVAGNKLWGWDETEGRETDKEERGKGGYPWAQCYGGYQFGQWAGQLGDGRAISLFEVPAADTAGRTEQPPLGSHISDYAAPLTPTPSSYELQLKGAGQTPYSRFADGYAVLRSSIREFVVSEALHALGIPTTRALALTRLPELQVHRERLEPGAIVARFAPTWLRLGTFDLLRMRGERALTRQLADYVAENVFGGWQALPGGPPGSAQGGTFDRLLSPSRGFPPDAADPPTHNRYLRLYREAVRRNARTVACWQAYGFMNGVLNTDNTSVAGLSLDFGPFAFLDHFDPSYTPNHDDHHLRYSYRNQASVVWWNLARFGEALGELIAAGPRLDHPAFVEAGIVGLAKVDAGGKDAETAEQPDAASADLPPAVASAAEVLATHAQDAIMAVGEEYKALFLAEYRRIFLARLGLPPPTAATLAATADGPDMDPLITGLLDVLEQLELDFHLFFRRLSAVRLADIATNDARCQTARHFFYREGLTTIQATEPEACQRIADWLEQWRERVVASNSGPDPGPEDDPDAVRIAAMKAVNPNFVPRGWILDEVIRRVEHENDSDALRRILHMALHPFADAWHGQSFDGEVYSGDADEELRWTQDVPSQKRGMQCSCSS